MNFNVLLKQLLRHPEEAKQSLNKLHSNALEPLLIAEFISAFNSNNLAAGTAFSICQIGNSKADEKSALAQRISRDFPLLMIGKHAPINTLKNADYILELKALEPLFKDISPINLLDLSRPWMTKAKFRAKAISVQNIQTGQALAEVAARLSTPSLILHNTTNETFGASANGTTKFWISGLGDTKIHSGAFFPEDYGFKTGQKETELDLNEAVIREFFESLV